MKSKDKKYYDVSSYDILNVIDVLFSEDTILRISDCYHSFLVDCNFGEFLEETDQEKYLYTVTCANAYLESKLSEDPIYIASESLRVLDINALKMSLYAGKVEEGEGGLCCKRSFNVFLENKSYLNGFFNMYNIDVEMQQKIICCLENGQISNELEAFLLGNDDVFRGFITFITASVIEKQKEVNNKEVDKGFFFKCLKAAKSCVECFPDEYQLWEASVIDKESQLAYIKGELLNQQHDSQSLNKIVVITIFMNYYLAYESGGKYLIFEHDLKEICKTPAHTSRFILFLKEFEYGADFCLGYQKYLEETNVSQIFSPKILTPNPLKLVKDTDNSHKDWFVSIHSSKFLKNTLKDKYDALVKLCSMLKAKDLIESDTPLGLFVYRFSGLQSPFAPESSMKWTGTKTKLAVFINLLYDNEIEIPYSKVAAFFGFEPKKTNLSSHYNPKNQTVKKHVAFIREILIECGFNPNRL